ncbi:class I adenylate-forming enzyme family protein [Bradyrhizobium sp. 2TAF24]|uniref:class I adenylate-forming enzyme family protein n=1 Tax=Bradyrhizobium sp. 2TAF24 TaxID=3233011 RepID=UPI003F92CEFE
MSVTAALASHAARMPQRDALVFEDQRLTSSVLNGVINRLAAFVAAATPPASGVALHLPTGPALALLVLAVARAGREAQVLDPQWPAAMTRATLAQLVPAWTVSTDAGLAGAGVTVLDDPFMPAAELLSVLGAPADVPVVAEPDDLLPFYVGFTSGSTGEPKGYRRHHRSWSESFRHDAIEFGVGADDVVLAPGTLTHSLFLYALMHGLHAGARVVLCRRFRPDAVVRLIEEEQASVLYGVPTQLQLIADAAGDRAFSSLRWLLSSGAKSPPALRAQLLSRFPQARFAEFYGASETSFMTVAKAEDDVPEGSVGRAFSGATITIRDRAGRALPAGRVGYVFVTSPFLFMAYACGEAADLLHHGDAISVGDIGFRDGRGFLHLVGRAGRKIVTSGKNVYPEEIERVLERHPAVATAAVLGIDDARRGERLVALLQLQPDSAVVAADLIAHARRALPLTKVPRIYATVADWPLTRSGKTDFEALRVMFRTGAAVRLS